MVGSGTRFSVVKGNKATISPEDTQTEIMGSIAPAIWLFGQHQRGEIFCAGH